MNHPFTLLAELQLRRLFYIFLAVSFALLLILNSFGMPLTTPQAPAGIVSFEFSWTIENAQKILDSWGESGKVRAGFIQGFDFLFLTIYPQAFALGCLLASRRLERRDWPGAALGTWFAWGMWMAGLLDVVENIALTFLLLNAMTGLWTLLAGICASVKFSLLLVGLFFSIYGWLAGSMQPRLN